MLLRSKRESPRAPRRQAASRNVRRGGARGRGSRRPPADARRVDARRRLARGLVVETAVARVALVDALALVAVDRPLVAAADVDRERAVVLVGQRDELLARLQRARAMGARAGVQDGDPHLLALLDPDRRGRHRVDRARVDILLVGEVGQRPRGAVETSRARAGLEVGERGLRRGDREPRVSLPLLRVANARRGLLALAQLVSQRLGEPVVHAPDRVERGLVSGAHLAHDDIQRAGLRAVLVRGGRLGHGYSCGVAVASAGFGAAGFQSPTSRSSIRTYSTAAYGASFHSFAASSGTTTVLRPSISSRTVLPRQSHS